MRTVEITRSVQRDLKKNTNAVELEDSLVLELCDFYSQNTKEIEELFHSFMKKISDDFAKNRVDCLEMIRSYKELDVKLDDVLNIEATLKEKFFDKVKSLDAIYLNSIARILSYNKMNDYNMFLLQYRIVKEKLSTKLKSCIENQLKESNMKLRMQSESAFNLVNEILLKEEFQLEENTLDEIEEDLREYEYIDDYRELNRLAEKNGYVYKSQSGSHRKFENDDGCVVIIPQHTLGVGLSLKIQKNIINK